MSYKKDASFIFKPEKDKYIWQNKYVRIIFSDGKIEPHSGILYPETINDIMYFYYSVKIQKLVIDDFEKETYKWKTVSKTYTHDFPCIDQLVYILEELPNIDVVSNGEKHTYRDNSVLYSKHYWTQGFGCDDFYELTRFVNQENKTSHYIGYFGTSSGVRYGEDSNGIRLINLTDYDLKALKLCVNAFIDYTIKTYNKNTKEDILELTKSLEIKNNKLYHYDKDKTIKSIITENSYCCLFYKALNEDNKEVEYECDNVLIEKIEDNFLYIDNDKVSLEDITYIYQEVPEEKLFYNEEEIMKDFISIMDDEIKNDFLTLDIQELFKKYIDALIDRTWMCRSEHNFVQLFDESEANRNVKTVVVIAKNIIKDIKEYLLKETN